MAPSSSPHTHSPESALVKRQQPANGTSIPTVTARLGNFIKTSANYSCEPVQINYSNVVPPATISLLSGNGLPQAFFLNKPTYYETYMNLVQTIAVVNDTQGSIDWPINVNIGSYVGFTIMNQGGLRGFSELRTVYAGSRGDPTCRAVVDDPASNQRNYSLPLVGSFDTNIYVPTDTIPCQMPVQYSMSYKPGRLEAFNATGLPMRFFEGDTDGIEVQVLETIANLTTYSMGTEYWTPNVPVGTRMGFKLTDGRGQVAYSEVRTVYQASEQTRSICQSLAPTTNESSSSSGMADKTKYAIGVIILFSIAFLGLFCARARRRRQSAALNRPSLQRPAAPNSHSSGISFLSRRKFSTQSLDKSTTTPTQQMTEVQTLPRVERSSALFGIEPDVESAAPSRTYQAPRQPARARVADDLSSMMTEPLPRYEPAPPSYDGSSSRRE
ncbi:hypothetical protein ACM66B_001130 [Microbotryomycetes sp. NB124-2]